MMKTNWILLLGAMALAASCAKETEQTPSGPVSLKAIIADETKATLNETTGTFAFTGSDAIKVFNGSGVYGSTSVSLDGTTATFTMPAGFTNTGAGYAAYPASSVTGITAGGVTFTLPASYTYAQVGGTDASSSLVPCPMMASFTGGQDLEFKQAGALIRFRIKNCLAGDLTFTFKTQVTGTVTLTSIPSGDNGGILADNILNNKDNEGGYSIKVTGVPAVSGDEDCFYVTLPVPVGTDSKNVSVWNDGGTSGRFKNLSGTVAHLKRAEGYKRGVTLEERSSMTFGGFSIAGFLYNYNNTSYGVLQDPLELLKHYNHNYSDRQYYFSWNDIINSPDEGTRHIPDLFTETGVQIGQQYYHVPSGGTNGQWGIIMGTGRASATVNSNNAHYAFVTVTGLNTLSPDYYPVESIRGLLLFPDNATIAVDNTLTGVSLTTFDASSATANNTITLSVLRTLESKGCVFLPTAGYSEVKNKTDTWGDINVGGYYWSRTNYRTTYAYALAITYDGTLKKYTLEPKNAYDRKATAYFPIMLIQL